MTALVALLALAATPDTVELELPADRVLPMEIGKQYVVRVPALRMVGSGCRDSIDLKTLGNDRVLLIPVAECIGGVVYFWAGKKQQSITLGVSSVPGPLFPKVVDGMRIGVEIGRRTFLHLPGVQRIAPACRNEHNLMTVGGGLIEVTARATCTGDHLIWKASGERLSVRIRSVEALPPQETMLPVKQRVDPVTVVDERGTRSDEVTVIEIPTDLRDVKEEKGPDGGLRLVGLASDGTRVVIDLTPKPAGKKDGG